MRDSIFLDTNILVYLYSETEPEKAKIAKQCAEHQNVWISTQVLNELSNVLHRKFSIPYLDILAVIQELEIDFLLATISHKTIKQALLLGDRYRYSYFDSLMLASSLEQGCTTIYTEDMQHNQEIESQLVIRNPFA
jgi:predicted nucleic acid-binding protein